MSQSSLLHLLPCIEGFVLQLVFASSLTDLFAAVTIFRIQGETFMKSFICVSIALGKRFKQINPANNEGQIKIYTINDRTWRPL